MLCIRNCISYKRLTTFFCFKNSKYLFPRNVSIVKGINFYFSLPPIKQHLWAWRNVNCDKDVCGEKSTAINLSLKKLFFCLLFFRFFFFFSFFTERKTRKINKQKGKIELISIKIKKRREKNRKLTFRGARKVFRNINLRVIIYLIKIAITLSRSHFSMEK